MNQQIVMLLFMLAILVGCKGGDSKIESRLQDSNDREFTLTFVPRQIIHNQSLETVEVIDCQRSGECQTLLYDFKSMTWRYEKADRSSKLRQVQDVFKEAFMNIPDRAVLLYAFPDLNSIFIAHANGDFGLTGASNGITWATPGAIQPLQTLADPANSVFFDIDKEKLVVTSETGAAVFALTSDITEFDRKVAWSDFRRTDYPSISGIDFECNPLMYNKDSSSLVTISSSGFTEYKLGSQETLLLSEESFFIYKNKAVYTKNVSGNESSGPLEWSELKY